MTSGPLCDEMPFVSIVIPARNEARDLPRVFAAIGALDYPAAYREVILVDNGSTDETAAIARRAGARVIAAPGMNVGGVRNAGARAARGEILAFLDADCLAGPLWLNGAVARLADERVGAVGGNCEVGHASNWVQRAWVVDQPPGARDAQTLATASFLMRKRLFDELGGFDESLMAGEDDDLARRVRAAGYRLQRAAECSVIHLGYPDTLRGIMRRQLWHGRSQLHGAWHDPMVLLTHLFALFLFVLAPAGVVLWIPALVKAGLGGSLLLALAPALRKEWRGGGISWERLAQRTVVYWWFLLGRAGGLLRNYGDRIARLRRPARARGS